MGGYGSGQRWNSKKTTFFYRRLDVRRWQREGLLVAGQSFLWQWMQNGKEVASIGVRNESDRVTLSYRHRANEQETWRFKQYPVWLAWTRCNYGGRRAWFICPACGRRVAILYDGGAFGCRRCYGLAYNSQRQSAFDRAISRAQAIRRKLGGSGNLIEPLPWKPKRMHWRTYQRLCSEAAQRERVFLGFAMSYVQRLSRRVGL